MSNNKRGSLKYTLFVLLATLTILFSGCLLAPVESSEVIFETEPAEVEIMINGELHTSPSRVVVRAGSELLVEVMLIETMESASLPGNDTRFVFDRWEDGDTNNPRHVVVNGDKTYKALMAKEYRVEVVTDISVAIEGSGWYRKGVSVSLKAPVVEGYEFLHWEVNGEICSDQREMSLPCDSPRSVLARYREKDPTLSVTAEPLKTIEVSVDGESLRTPASLIREFNSQVVVSVPSVIEKNSSEIFSGFDTRYAFDQWEGVSGSGNPLEFRIRNDTALVAVYSTEHKVEVVTNPEGLVEIAGSGWKEKGTVLSLSASDLSGYNFSYWEINGQSKGSSKTIEVKVDGPKKVVAVYTEKPPSEHTLTVNTSPVTGLNVKVSGQTYQSPKTMSFEEGSNVSIEAISPQERNTSSHVSGNDTRYSFLKWNDGNTSKTRTVTITEDIGYTAEMKIEYKVETSSSPSVATTSGSGWHESGKAVTFTAPSVNGYNFLSWEVNDQNKGSNTTLSIDIAAPLRVVAIYNTHPSMEIPDQEVEKGEALSLSLLNWSNDPDGDELSFTLVSGPGSISGSTYSLNTTTVDTGQHEVRIKADDGRGGVVQDSFVITVEKSDADKYRLTVSTTPEVGLNVKVAGQSYVSPGEVLVEYGASRTIEAVSPQERDISLHLSGKDARYSFVKWSDGSTLNSRTVTITEDIEFIAQMNVEFKVEVLTKPEGLVEIPGGGWREEGSVFSLSASELNGYNFSHWEINGQNKGSSKTIEVKVDGPKKVVAVYTEKPPSEHTLTVNTSPVTGLNVKVSGQTYQSPKTMSFEEGSNVSIEAISPQERNTSSHVSGNDTRYSFLKWNDGNTSKTRTVTITEDIGYTAEMKIEYKVETSSSPSVATISGSGWHESGKSIMFTVPSVSGYNFLNWKVNDQNKGSNTNLSIDIATPLRVVAIYNTHPSMEIPDQEVEKGETLSLSLLNWSNDPDGDTLTFTLVSGPGSISGSTYSLNTTNVDTGQHEVRIKADDGRGGEVETSFLVEVVLINRPPDKPSNPSPSDNASGIGLNITLSWTCNDPDGDPLTYDVYFGTSSNPPKVASSISASSYQVGSLEAGKKYYWRIVAKDPGGAATSGDTWQFTTADGKLDFSGPVYYGDILLVSNESINSGSTQHTGTLSEEYIQTSDAPTPRGLPLDAYAINPVIPEPDYVDNSMLAYKDPYEIQSMEPLSVGTTREFWVYNFRTNSRYQITATLQYLGGKSEVWAEDTEVITQSRASQIGQEFNNVIYSLVTTYFYTPSDVSGNGRVAILCFDIQDNFENTGAYVAGYFDAGDLYNTTYSNRMEIFYIDTYPTMHYPRSNPPNVSRAFSTIVHEFQHMVNFNRNRIVEGGSSMPTWLNEGMSMAAEHIYGGALSGRISYYNRSSSIQNGHSLLRWGDNGDRLANYALSYLFLQYVREQCGQGDWIFREMLLDSANDYRAVENVIKKYVDPNMSLGEFMTSFRLALLLKESSGLYGFNGSFSNISTRMYTGNGKTLYGGATLFKSINDSFTDPGNGGSSIQYVGIHN